ncbi:hypothetical protein MSAS_54070 [Mycobacterium saskatchewanense]|uniref:NAD(P)-dependent oxidoreductase n=1 Tax=Mycobacterium saskatchewanense TaxID=220927 RepID=A0AAJ3NPP8_9MYCO|nr:SDR family oxidoreductase [Mycobacterium saskatchewanense]ORW71036.1 NAD(P)-dependent oxidoreductase [Mycobacterium saskatchewanense]BBX66233.1 hypothetical protein MSAS_54070 [Mycobacterium saskatchewanense]
MNFAAQQQTVPGVQSEMNPVPDCGENSYRGTGRLTGKKAIITGGDSGIGRAVAIAFAREGADVLISYLNEDEDARDVARHVEGAGRTCVLVPGDLSDPEHCRAVVDRAVQELGGVDILVNNAAYQMLRKSLDEISDEEWDYTFRLNIGAYSVESFGDNVPLGRAGQPVELAPIYVLLASDDASYISGARVAVTGGRPIL